MTNKPASWQEIWEPRLGRIFPALLLVVSIGVRSYEDAHSPVIKHFALLHKSDKEMASVAVTLLSL